ncbi:hypothetical protein [Streptomyces sp. PTD5-9]|uniref:hypothetical protein n=1 Tax=Streptomyces sp. PTD5-9 TaxID=3120150 RepID=UPI00300A19D3
MAGTSDAVADDALYVLTAALLTPAQFPSLLGDDYPAACAVFGLEPWERGYGLVLGQDGDGARWTVVVDDVSPVAVAIAAWDCGIEHDLSPDDRSMVCALPGWPLPVAVAAPGLDAPHDPPPDPEVEGAGPAPLSPPDMESWGPAQRRLGADEIARQWTSWRERLDDEAASDDAASDAPDTANGSGGSPANGPGNGPGNGTASAPAASPPAVSHPGLGRVLAEARAYLDAPPPPGRVRSSFAAGDARMLRVDGPGWSLVARTDDMAFVLLDDEPGTVLPVGRGAELPGLLGALDALAVRPA